MDGLGRLQRAKDVIPRPILAGMLLAAIALPITVLVLIGAGSLLGAMQDVGAATAVGRVATGCGIAWVVDLVVLLVALGVNAAAESPRNERSRSDEPPQGGREP